MDILTVGRWAMMIFGFIAVLAALILTFFKPEPVRRLFLTWVFGILLTGLGIFGLEFMPKYKEWLDALSGLVKNPGEESYKNFLTKAGKDELPYEVQKIGISYAVNNPIENFAKMLDDAAKSAPEGKKGKVELKKGLQALKEKQNVVDWLLLTKPGAETVKKFDPATAELFYQKLTTLSDSELRRLDIKPDQLREFKPQ